MITLFLENYNSQKKKKPFKNWWVFNYRDFFVQALGVILNTYNYRKYKKLSVVLMHKNKCHIYSQLITLYDKKFFQDYK